MKSKLVISAWDVNPTDNAITADIMFFLEQCFKTAEIVNLKENNKDYTESMINDLANDILSIREAGK